MDLSGTETVFTMVLATRLKAWSGVSDLIIGDAKRSRLEECKIPITPCPDGSIPWIIGLLIMKKKGKRKLNKRKQRVLARHLEAINLYAAGIDVGSEAHYVAVPEGLDDEPVRHFGCFTADLDRLADWLVRIGIQTVVMESTGVYWIPLFEVLEERGLEVLLVNARHVKNVSGRKTDVLDCQWLQQLHTFGLLSGAFRPPEHVCALRSYMRQRQTLTGNCASHIQHMQKALRLMNLLLDNVVSDVAGMTGLRIIRAIVAGERDGTRLAAYRDGRCKRSEEEIAQSLQGHYRDEHVFSLTQALELFDIYQDKITACDQMIERQLNQFEDQADEADYEPNPSNRKYRNGLNFDVSRSLFRMTGIDLTRIDGICEMTTLKVLSETGIDMSPWKSSKQFCSWLALSPGSKISGGKVLSSKTVSSANRAAAAFRMAAYTLSNSKSALGAYYRRMRSKLGAPKAITATAHKLARLFYSMLKNGTEYVDQGQDYYDKQYKERTLRNLRKRAASLGYTLTETTDDLPIPSMS